MLKPLQLMHAAACPQIIAKETCFQNLVNRQVLKLFQRDHFAPLTQSNYFEGKLIFLPIVRHGYKPGA